MHPSVWAFATDALPDVTGKRVVEVGSYDYNGTLHTALEGHASYLGTDMQDGPNVDLVCPAENLPDVLDAGCADVVISTEMLEHAEDWRGSIRGMVHILAPGGYLLLTTRSQGFPYHPHPEDYWRFPVKTMGRILAAVGLDVVRLEPDPPPTDGVFALARKPVGWVAHDPTEDPLADIHAGPAQGPPGLITDDEGEAMQQATDSGWYSTADGGEVFIRKGTVRPDGHPDVKAVPSLFGKLPNEEKAPAKAAPARAAAKKVAEKVSAKGGKL